jgi:lipid-A-disaccharide synthase-like uncharacterized protein
MVTTAACVLELLCDVQYLATKSLDTSRVPRLLSIVQLVGSLTWITYGALVGDNFVVVPNLVGATFAAIQLLVLLYIHVRQRYFGGVVVKSLDAAQTQAASNAEATTVDIVEQQANHAEQFQAELATLGTNSIDGDAQATNGPAQV